MKINHYFSKHIFHFNKLKGNRYIMWFSINYGRFIRLDEFFMMTFVSNYKNS